MSRWAWRPFRAIASSRLSRTCCSARVWKPGIVCYNELVWGVRALSALLVVLSLAASGLAIAVSGAAASSTVGYDISYPQCSSSFPASPAFGIVGANDGKPYSANPCLGTGDGSSELQWAGMSAELYANTANPGPTLSTHWPNGQTSPEQCNTASYPGSDTAQCAYDYGWNAAADSYQDAVSAYISLGWAQPGATRTPVANRWWLDVEAGNSWTSNTAFNVDVLQGEVDYLSSVGAGSIGFYSSSSDWQTITGGTTSFAAYQSWMPGASTLSQAQASCTGGGVTGGGVALAQYPYNGFDADYRCAAPAPSLSFATAPQTLTAGSSSGPMSVALPQASSSVTAVSVTSSSNNGSLATSPSGPWSSSLTLSVPAGSTRASFYYDDTRVGQPVLTASASGYSNATQTETVTAAALANVVVTPTSAQVRVGGQVSFSAAGRDRYGNSVSVTPSWSISPTLGSFSPNPGNPVTFTAGAAGTGTVTASVGAISGQASVMVTTKKHVQTTARLSMDAPTLATIIGMPQAGRCVSGPWLSLTLRTGAAAEFRLVRLLVDDKLAETARIRALTNLLLQVRLPSAQRHTVTIVALTWSGHKITATGSYRACGQRSGHTRGQHPTMLPVRLGG